MSEPFFTQEEHLLGALVAVLPIVRIIDAEPVARLILQTIDAAGYKIAPKEQPRQDWPKQGYCRMLALNGAICTLERLHKGPHEALDGYTWKGGQPRQVDPSGAVSSSTTSEQPADPAALRVYHNLDYSKAADNVRASLCYCNTDQICSYCRDAL